MRLIGSLWMTVVLLIAPVDAGGKRRCKQLVPIGTPRR